MHRTTEALLGPPARVTQDRIARAMLEHITEGMALMLSVGSTTLAFARQPGPLEPSGDGTDQ